MRKYLQWYHSSLSQSIPSRLRILTLYSHLFLFFLMYITNLSPLSPVMSRSIFVNLVIYLLVIYVTHDFHVHAFHNTEYSKTRNIVSFKEIYPIWNAKDRQIRLSTTSQMSRRDKEIDQLSNPISPTDMQFISENSDYNLANNDESREFFGAGPGHTSMTPFNTSIRGKKDALKIVLSLALIWVVINEKYNELKKKIVDAVGERRAKAGVVKVDSNISYEDIIPGIREPEYGELLMINLKMSYNGRIIRPDEYIRESRQVDSVQFIKSNTLESDIETAYDVSGVKDALSGLWYGGRRIIKAPAYIVLKNKDIPYFIDPEGMISIDVTTSKI